MKKEIAKMYAIRLNSKKFNTFDIRLALLCRRCVFYCLFCNDRQQYLSGSSKYRTFRTQAIMKIDIRIRCITHICPWAVFSLLYIIVSINLNEQICLSVQNTHSTAQFSPININPLRFISLRIIQNNAIIHTK